MSACAQACACMPLYAHIINRIMKSMYPQSHIKSPQEVYLYSRHTAQSINYSALFFKELTIFSVINTMPCLITDLSKSFFTKAGF